LRRRYGRRRWWPPRPPEVGPTATASGVQPATGARLACPGAGDDANIIGASIFNFTVTYDYTGSAVTLNSLTVDQAGTAFVTHGATLSMAANKLFASTENIGDSSNGGSNGRGTFTQSGGVNHVNGSAIGILGLGEKSSDLGTYNLSGNASLQVDNTEFLGDFGSGTINQTGGSNTCPSIVLGNQTGSNGSYSLSAGNLSAQQIAIGTLGTGSFTQSGGINLLQGVGPNQTALLIGVKSSANNTYTLNSGTLTVAGDESIGDGGMGTFNQSGGTHTLAIIQTLIGDFDSNLYVGNSSGAVGAYMLSGTAKLECSGTEYIGYSGAGTFTQSGGTNTIDDGPLLLGNNVNSNGTYNLSGGTLDCSSFGCEQIGVSGTAGFTQSGGTNHSIDLTLAVKASASGTYTLTNGALNLDRDLEIGELGSGTFTQSGGTATISSNVFVGDSPGTGLLNISGTGQFSVVGSLIVDNSTANRVTLNGGSLSAGSLTCGGILAVTKGLVNVGAMTLNSTSILDIGLGGASRGADYGAVIDSGSLGLGGALQVSLVNGFLPVAGNTFDILDWSTLSGTFSSVTLPTLNGRIVWKSSQLFTNGTLSVVATFLAGDFNRDGHVDAGDVLAMEQALVDLPDYQTAKGLTTAQLMLIGDINGDGEMTNADLQALLIYLKSGNGSGDPAPEPTSAILLLAAIVLVQPFQKHLLPLV
jgi:hypothetical protein